MPANSVTFMAISLRQNERIGCSERAAITIAPSSPKGIIVA